MLTVQACQQHRLAVMHLNKVKSFPAATVSAVAKLGHRRRGKRGTRSEERRNARRAHESKQKCRRWRSRGVVGVLHPTRRKNEGKNLGRQHLELSERGRAFARKKRRGKAINGVNDIAHIDTLLRTCAAKGCDVIGLLDTKRDGTSEISASGYRVFLSGDCSIRAGKGSMGLDCR